MVAFIPAATLALQAGGLASGIMGQRAQARQAQAQLNLGYEQLYLQRRLARLQEEMARAGSTDARGNKVEYVPGVGWVETPSDRTRALMDASDTEELLRLVQDQPRERIIRELSMPRRVGEASLADARQREFANTQGRSRDTLEGLLMESNLAHINDPIDTIQNNISVQALRSGSSAAPIIEALAQRGARDTRSAIADARLGAENLYQTERAGRESMLLDPYNMLATRAQQPGDVAFQPNNLAEGLAARSAATRQAAGTNMYGAMMGTSSMPKFDKPPAAPNYGAGGLALWESLQKFMQTNPFGSSNPAPSAFKPDISETMYGGQYARHF